MKTPWAFCGLLTVLFILNSCATTAGPAVSAVPLAQRPGVVVFTFEVKSPDAAYAGLGSDIAQALTEALLKGKSLKPIEREQLQKILEEQDFSTSGLVREEDALKVGRLSGAKFILLGSVSVIAGQVRLNARLLDVETAEIITAESVAGKLEGIFALEEALARKVEAMDL